MAACWMHSGFQVVDLLNTPANLAASVLVLAPELGKLSSEPWV